VLTTAIALMVAWGQLCTFLQYANSQNSPPEIDPLRTFVWAFVSKAIPILGHPGHWILFLNSLLIPITLVAYTFFSFGDMVTHFLAGSNL